MPVPCAGAGGAGGEGWVRSVGDVTVPQAETAAAASRSKRLSGAFSCLPILLPSRLMHPNRAHCASATRRRATVERKPALPVPCPSGEQCDLRRPWWCPSGSMAHVARSVPERPRAVDGRIGAGRFFQETGHREGLMVSCRAPRGGRRAIGCLQPPPVFGPG